MSALIAELRSIGGIGGHTGIAYWCPGCDGAHAITTERGLQSSRPIWQWDGNVDAPTVSPSILVTYGHGEKPPDRCHSFLRNGVLEFLGDCTHALAGQHVPLPDWPEQSGAWDR